MTPRYALFGCNPLAIEVAWRLSMVKLPFILVDRDPALVARAREEGLSAEHMDYTDDDALRAAGIGAHIEGVFCLLGEDSENVFLAISARALAPGLRIVAVCQAPEAAPSSWPPAPTRWWIPTRSAAPGCTNSSSGPRWWN